MPELTDNPSGANGVKRSTPIFTTQNKPYFFNNTKIVLK